MDPFECFDQFGQYSKWGFQQKMKQSKFQSIYSFIEECLSKYYEAYKKNKKTDISYSDYRRLMLKKLVLHNIQIHRFDPDGPIEYLCRYFDRNFD